MSVADRLTKLTTDITNAYISIDNKVKKILPEGYTRVEYIESTGTQFIQTGVVNNGYKSESIIEYTAFQNTRQLTGESMVGFWGINVDNYFEMYQLSSKKAELSKKYDVIFEVAVRNNMSYRNLKVDNDILFTDVSSSTLPTSGEISIFKLGGNVVPFSCYMKLYSQKMWNRLGTLVRHFIPCYRNSDNEIGLYDIVNNQFYTNAGTGTFLKGSNTATGLTKNTNNLHTAIDSIEVIEQQTAEGESLSLTNTKAMPYKDYVVKGKSEQATGKSKNLFDYKQITPRASRTIENGGFVINNTDYQHGSPVGILKNLCPDLKVGDKFKFNWDTNATRNGTTVNYIYLSSYADVLRQNTLYTCTQTMLDSDTFFYGQQGEYYKNIMFYLEGQTSDYEPYGEKPSPSNPSEIHSVADDVNLFDESKVSRTVSGFTFSYDNKKIKLTGTANSTYFGTNNISQNIKAGTYTFSSTNTNSNLTYNMWLYNSSNQLIGNTKVNNPVTISEDATYYVLFVEGLTNGTTYNEEVNVKLQKGSTATPYSPYNQGTVTIKQRGKNLFDISKINSVVTEYTVTIQNGGFVINTGGMSNGGNFGLFKNFCPDLKVGDKFKFSWNSNATRNNNNVNYIYLSQYANTIIKDTLYTCTQTMLDSDMFFYGQQGEYYKNIIFYLDGQTADYEPYNANNYTFQTEPLRSLPSGVKDTIEADGIHRRVGRVVLDGSETWWENTNYTTEQMLVASTTLTEMKTGTTNIISSIAKYANPTVINSIRAMGNVIGIGLDKTEFLTINDFKTWLSNHNIEVLYELETETIEPLTQNQSNTLLDITHTGSYENTTNIYTDEDVKPTIGVGYYKKV